MFDIGWQELFIVAVLAIIVIGPKDLPRAVGAVTKWIRKARSLARDFQDGLDEVAREAELDDIRNEIDRPGGLDIGKKIGEAIDPDDEIGREYNLDKDLYDEMTDAADELRDTTDPGKAAAAEEPAAEPSDKAEAAADAPAPADPPKKASG